MGGDNPLPIGQNETSSIPRFRLFFALLLMAGIGFRVAAANKSFWLDELHTTELAHVSPSEMIDKLTEDFHAPVYFLSVTALDRLGLEGHALRLGAILFNLLGLLPLLALARRAEISQLATLGLLATYLLAPFQIRYGVELRPYSLLGLGCLTMAWAAFDTKASNRLGFIVFMLAVALSLYVHYLSAAFVVGLGAARLMWRGGGRLPTAKLILGGTLGVVMFSPWVLTMESWMVNDPQALVRSDQKTEAERAALPAPPGFQEMRPDLLAIVPRTLAPGASSLGKNPKRLVLFGVGVALLAMACGLVVALRRWRFAGLVGPVVSAVLAMFLIAILCVRFWHRIPIQYFSVGAWAWSFVAAMAIDGVRSTRARTILLLVIVLGFGLGAIGEVVGSPREDLANAVRLASDLAKDKGAHLTAILRQPSQYTNTEIYRVYLGENVAQLPESVPANDGQSVVVLTRRTPLEDGGGPKKLMGPIRRSRTIVERIDCGRALVIYVFR